MEFNWNKFFEDKTSNENKSGGLVVHCGTQEEKIDFFKELNNRVSENYRCDMYDENGEYFSYNYFRKGLGYSSKDFYEMENANIVDWKDYYKPVKPINPIPKLENGMIAETRNGERFFVFNDKFMNSNRINWFWVFDCNENLEVIQNGERIEHLDIMKLYKTKGYSLNTLFKYDYLTLIWERQELQELKFPAIYKHFKNKFYATMGIAHRLDEKDFFDLIMGEEDYVLNVKFTESEDLMIKVFKKGDNYYYCNCYVPKDVNDIVLYKSLYDDSPVYGRPFEMFAGKVDKDKYPNVEQKWRLELYQY